MKKFLAAFFTVLLSPLSISAQTGPYVWTSETAVASSTYQNLRARIAVNSNDEAVVVWGHGGLSVNYAAVGNSGGFSAPVQISTPGMNLWVSDWIGTELAYQGNDVFATMFGQNFGEWSVYTVHSSDGGSTWGDTVRVSPFGFPALYPSMDIGPNGPVVMYMEHNGNFSQPRYVSATSMNGGLSYNAPVQISAPYAPGEVCDCCPAHINSDGQDVFALFRNNDNNQRDMYLAWSDNNGASYGGAADVEPGSWQLFGCPSSGASSMIFGDSIRYVWMTGSQGPARVYMGTMHRITKQVGYTAMVYDDPNQSIQQNFPVIAGEGDEFMIVWELSESGNKDVQFVYSNTGTVGTSLPQPVHVNTAGFQTNPDLEYVNGTYHIVWSDANTGEVKYRTAAQPVMQLSVKAFLEGPFDGVSMMNDDLRTLAQFPLTEPYTALGYSHVGEGGGESISPSVLAVTGSTAIVDWVVLELRDKNNASLVINTKSALIRRDGQIVDLDGVSPVSIGVPSDNYHVAVRHRNHFGIMGAGLVNLSPLSTASRDFTLSFTPLYGTNATKEVNGRQVMWAGNSFWDDVIKYTGFENDRDKVLVKVGGSVPTATAIDYSEEDINMDGVVKYTGQENDRDRILVNIGGSVPTNTILEQLP